ncbi:MAG: polyprenyl synthetase family protein [Chloroflexi bacterium]|nr:MAG: polyprenyl synthetase family protein [Chloroflexota bacterium]TMF15545.1 MAG: polyprenyl synthetase family protein [Chloroflexota bacterium]
MAETVLDYRPVAEVEDPPALLTRHLPEIEAALRRSSLPSRSHLGRMAAYHMGWTDADGAPRPSAGGKRIRPALAIWACEALGGPIECALPAAVAVELVHNFTLIHDDIQDGDTQRRHRPTVWSIWGAPQGINAGDGIFALALRTLLTDGPRAELRMRAAHTLSAAVVEVVEGQCLDLSLEGSPALSQAAYLRLASAKTGALLGASLASGALLAGASTASVRRFEAAGRLLGLAFQIRDDWLGTWGDPELTGKAQDGDLRRRKLTYPVVAAYEVATSQQRRELRRRFSRREPGGERALRALLDELGGPSLTAGVPLVLARDAVAAIDPYDISHEALHDFAEVAVHVAERDH